MHTRRVCTLSILALGLGLISSGCTVIESGDGDGEGGASSGSKSSGSSSNTSFTCCINGEGYACPNKAAFDQCGGGFDIDACMQACPEGDFACQDACFEQWTSGTPDPSACAADASIDCSSSGPTSGPSTGSGPACTKSDVGAGCDYDDDCCSDNCYQGTCNDNTVGSGCDYDDDCDSANCYQGTCFGNSAGDPCDYDDDCDSNNCSNDTCQ